MEFPITNLQLNLSQPQKKADTSRSWIWSIRGRSSRRCQGQRLSPMRKWLRTAWNLRSHCFWTCPRYNSWRFASDNSCIKSIDIAAMMALIWCSYVEALVHYSCWTIWAILAGSLAISRECCHWIWPFPPISLLAACFSSDRYCCTCLFFWQETR